MRMLAGKMMKKIPELYCSVYRIYLYCALTNKILSPLSPSGASATLFAPVFQESCLPMSTPAAAGNAAGRG